MSQNNNFVYVHHVNRRADWRIRPGEENDLLKRDSNSGTGCCDDGSGTTAAAGRKKNYSPASTPVPGKAQGMLYFCATPIGNLGDITRRVLQCLKEADLIAVESVKHSRKLLHYYEIRKPLISYREANREHKGREILARLKAGAKIALITDAGMPSISDPGFPLARLLLAENVPFTVLPGPSAVLTALVHSGYPADRFVFWGFLSRKKKERAEEIRALAAERKTVVFYEAPHRLLKTLRELAAGLGKREIAVCRELTKKYEEVLRGSAGEIFDHFSRVSPRGEFTLVLSPRARDSATPAGSIENEGEVKGKNANLWRAECTRELEKALQAGDPPTAAVKKVARNMGLPRQKVYALLVELKHGGGLA